MRAILKAIAVLACAAAVSTAQASAKVPDYGIGVRHISFVDGARGIRAAGGFGGSADRRVDVTVWYPAKNAGGPLADAAPAAGGPWPLVFYGHGTNGRADNATHIAFDLVRRGYVVAAPDFPLSSSAAWTRIAATDVGDVVNQTGDIRFLIDRLLADPAIGPISDPARIVYSGHSLGAVTGYFLAYGSKTRDPRIKAFVLIGAGDPVQTALTNPMGLAGQQHVEAGVPVLFLTAEKDIFARTTGAPFAAFSRVGTPKYEALIRGGAHVWFHDGSEQPEGNLNPDCLWFDRAIPGIRMPGCEERVPLIGPLRQQAITRLAIASFLDGWLKQDRAALARLRGLGRSERAVELRMEEGAQEGGIGR